MLDLKQVQRSHDVLDDKQLDDLLDQICDAVNGIKTEIVTLVYGPQGAEVEIIAVDQIRGGGPGAAGKTTRARGRERAVVVPKGGGTGGDPATATVINSSGVTVLGGQLVGFSSELVVLADATKATFIPASFVCTMDTPPNEIIPIATAGSQWLLLEPGVEPSIGDYAYLSASTPGMVRDSPPSGQQFQLIGQFLTERNWTNDMAYVGLHMMMVSRGGVL